MTSVRGNIVYYTVDGKHYMMSGRTWFMNNTYSTFRKALKKSDTAIYEMQKECDRSLGLY